LALWHNHRVAPRGPRDTQRANTAVRGSLDLIHEDRRILLTDQEVKMEKSCKG
jgi:hypothetical protein